jgi:hypothetical protein
MEDKIFFFLYPRHYNSTSLEKRHYYSSIRRSGVIIPFLLCLCHFLRRPRRRAHCQPRMSTEIHTDVNSASFRQTEPARGRLASPRSRRRAPDLRFTSPWTSALGAAPATVVADAVPLRRVRRRVPGCWSSCRRGYGSRRADGGRHGVASATPWPTAPIHHGHHLHHPGAGRARGGAPQSEVVRGALRGVGE